MKFTSVKRIGIIYPGAGHRQQVESGQHGRVIGHTAHDSKTGCQTYWFPTVAEFMRQAKDIFTGNYRFVVAPPVPYVEVEEIETDGTVIEDAIAPLMEEITKLKAVCEALRAERDALAAQVAASAPVIEEEPKPAPPSKEFPELAQKIVDTLNGKKMRLGELRAAIGHTDEEIKAAVNANLDIFAEINRGWVKLRADESEDE